MRPFGCHADGNIQREKQLKLHREDHAACAATAKFHVLRKIPIGKPRAAAWGAWHTAHPGGFPQCHKRMITAVKKNDVVAEFTTHESLLTQLCSTHGMLSQTQ